MSGDLMSTTPECVTTVWSQADHHFFEIVADVMTAEFLSGTTVLLASYDDDQGGPELEAESDAGANRTQPWG
jgi:hypothetical protein